MTPNERAFLDTIAWSEGTDNGIQVTRNKGYDVVVGGDLIMTRYVDHPRAMRRLTVNLSSTAAGRYQILAKYYDAYKHKLGLKDFSPSSQDAIAMQMIKEQKALADVNKGNFDEAVKKCANIWASFPGAGYKQREHKMDTLRAIYVKRGGSLNV